MSWNSFGYFQPFKNVKTVLSSWAIQKPAVGWTEPVGFNLLSSGQENSLSQAAPAREKSPSVYCGIMKVGYKSRINREVLKVPGLTWWLSGNESACQCRRQGFDSWVGDPGEGKWQPTPEFLLQKYRGHSSLVGYSSWGRKRIGHNLATKSQHWKSQMKKKKESPKWCTLKLLQVFLPLPKTSDTIFTYMLFSCFPTLVYTNSNVKCSMHPPI